VANPKNNRRYRPLDAADIYLKLRSDLYGYDPYFLEKIRLAEESNLKNSPVILANPHLSKLLLKDKVKPGEILTDRDIINSPYIANKVDNLAIWNSTINKLQQHEIAKQNAGNANTNVPTKGGIFTDKDIIDSANTVKNFVDTQHEIAKQNANNIPMVPYEPLDLNWKYDVNNFPVLPMIAASGSVNSPDTPANVGNEGPQTPNNANNPPAGTNTDTKGTGTNAGTGAGTKGTNKKDTGNPIGNSVKEKVNQDSNKGVGTTNVGTNTNTVKTPKTAEQIAYDRARLAADIAADTERSAIIQDYYNKYGINKQVPKAPNTPQVTKTALSEPQRDYYRYLTGYHRMSPNQAILSMGLDPTKYTF
jgi:hypothetical protein